MRFRRLLPALVLGALLAPAAARADEARLVLLHTTDLHGALTGWDDLADRPAARGLTRIATMVRGVRAEGAPVLLLDAGDCIQGAPLETVWREKGGDTPEPMTAAMSLIGYDAMAVGNHDLEFGRATVERARRAARFPWLAANILGPDGKPVFQPTLVKTLAGVRVGVIGLCTPAVPSWVDSAAIAGMRFESPVAAAKREVENLKREGCDVVVALAHTGLEREARPDDEPPDENWARRIAQEVPGLDALVIGHTHVVVASQRVGGVLISQAGKWGENLGRIDLTLRREAAGKPWTLAEKTARVIAVADSVAEDSALVRLAAPYRERTQQVLDEVVGRATATIGSPGGRFEDGPAWDLVHAAQLEASGAQVSLAALFDPAARIAAGPVTVRDLSRLYVYDNTLLAVELTGAELVETLERAARMFSTYDYALGRPLAPPGTPLYQFDAAGGVSYEIDLTRPPGQRIQNLILDGRPVAPGQKLRVAINNYRRNGGGGYTALTRAPVVWRSERGVRDLLIDYVRRHGTIAPATDRNWTVLPDWVTTPERPLIDRLVRRGVAPPAEILRLHPEQPGRRGDLAYWLSRSFGWRAKRLSGAFPDVPDSLEPWLDGLLQRKVLGKDNKAETFSPFGVVPLVTALDWCEGAARAAGYALASAAGDAGFRRGLVAGVDLGAGRSVFAYRDTLTRGQVLGLVSNVRFPVIRVLETTDFHGAILSRGRDRDSQRPIGGSVALAASLARLRAENPEGVVLLDGGDLFQGTMISNLAFGRPVVEQMNALGYTAAAIGNHEFDWTADTLERRVREMRFAALGANLREKSSGRMPSWVRSDTSVTRRGVRIGILGLCYPRTPSVTLPTHVAHLRFEDDSATAAAIVPRLRRAGADAVIGVGHIPGVSDSIDGLGGDLARLARGVRGVDAWLGGHSHNRLQGDPGGVPALIAGSNGEVIGVCDLAVDPVGNRVVDSSHRLEVVFADGPPDTAMQARVARWNAEIAPLAAEPLGRNAQRLGRSRGGESGVGNLVADAMRAEVGADIALQNSGGLRADLAAGVVTRGAVYEVLPFENTIVTMTLTGAEVRRALEEALRYERVTQVSGLRYRFDFGAPDFQRVVAIQTADGTALDETRTYKVATNNFMAEGGDDYAVLSKGRDRTDTGRTLRSALEDYVREKSRDGLALDVKLDGRAARQPGSRPPSRPD